MNKKIAVVADSHGNATALEAVIKDAETNGATEFWSLGDMGFGGSSTEDCYEMLSEVNTTQYLMGNWESAYNAVIANDNIDLSNPSDVYFATLVRYDYKYFSAERNNQIKNLPMTGQKSVLGILFSLTHNLPEKNRGHSLFPDKKEENFDKLNISSDMDVAIYAHTHTPVWRYTSDGQMVLNPGSVGQPWFSRQKLMNNREASYLLLNISSSHVENVDFRRVPYDIDAEIAHARNLAFPYIDLYEKLLKTGITSTHDKKTLDAINHEHNYVEKAQNFIDSLKK